MSAARSTTIDHARTSAANPRRRPLLAALAAVAVAGVLAGCAATDDDGSGSDNASAGGSGGGLTGGDFHSIVVDPSDPERIFVGGHQRVSESTDGGTTWTEISSLRDADAMGWAFAGDRTYVSGHPGLNVSVDQAGSFERSNDGLPGTDLHALGGNEQILYAAGPAVGVIARTEPDGQWEQRSTEAGQSLFGRILVDPTDADRLMAADPANGVVTSTDGGRTWQPSPSGLRSAVWISRSGSDGDIIAASGGAGAALSRDGGTTWEPLAIPAGASLVELSSADADTMYAGTHDGERVQISVSTDAGESWSQR